MIKTVQLSSPLNKIKEDKIIQTIKYYRKTSSNISKLQWNNFFVTGKFDKNLNIKLLNSKLSERYKQSAQYQTVGILNSFLSNLKNDFKYVLNNSSLSKETKEQLYKINFNNLWFLNFNNLIKDINKDKNKNINKDNKDKNINITDVNKKEKLIKEELIKEKYLKEEIKLANKIFKHLLKKNNKPTFNNCNMNLDFKVAEINKNVNEHFNKNNKNIKNKNNKIENNEINIENNEESDTDLVKDTKKTAISFDYWINLSTYELGNKILIPLKSNNYFDNINGNIKNFCQINLNHNNQLSFNLIKEELNYNKLEKEEQILKYKPEIESIGLDFGLVHLFSDNLGNHFGNHFYDKLKNYDKKITDLVKNNQLTTRKKKKDKNGKEIKIGKVRSHKYDNLIKKFRNWMENYIKRTLNNIVKVHKPGKIIMERLFFKAPNLSKRMNRILGNYGKQFINEKMIRLEEEYGIKTEYVNPAYTSQTCSNCEYIDKNNRKNQKEFLCLCCGLKINADGNGGKIIKTRSSCHSSNIYLNRKTVLRIQVENFINKKLTFLPNNNLKSFAKRSYFENNISHSSLAKKLDNEFYHILFNNPYFKDFNNMILTNLKSSKEFECVLIP